MVRTVRIGIATDRGGAGSQLVESVSHNPIARNSLETPTNKEKCSESLLVGFTLRLVHHALARHSPSENETHAADRRDGAPLLVLGECQRVETATEEDGTEEEASRTPIAIGPHALMGG
jgi:hypothetical protein